MSAEAMIYLIGAGIFSIAIIFMLMLVRNVEVNEERILKILGDDVEKIRQAKNDEELKAAIRALPKRKRTKLKTLFESQDLQVAMKYIKEFILHK